jgi:hypothetical protein
MRSEGSPCGSRPAQMGASLVWASHNRLSATAAVLVSSFVIYQALQLLISRAESSARCVSPWLVIRCERRVSSMVTGLAGSLPLSTT